MMGARTVFIEIRPDINISEIMLTLRLSNNQSEICSFDIIVNLKVGFSSSE